jgi:hypothetical protein
MALAIEIQAEPLTPEQAIALLEEAALLDAETFYAQAAELRQVAFTMSKVHNAATMGRIKQALERTMAEGGTIPDFVEWLETEAAPWSAWYSELVYRNAVQGSYMRARWQQMNQPHIRQAFPILVYDGIGDSRQTDLCRGLDGRWWLREDFPAGLYPPNHHACRSVVRMMTKTSAEALPGDRQATGAPDGAAAAEGWDGSPATDWQQMLERRQKVLETSLGVG